MWIRASKIELIDIDKVNNIYIDGKTIRICFDNGRSTYIHFDEEECGKKLSISEKKLECERVFESISNKLENRKDNI